MKKRIVSLILLAAICCMPLAACGKGPAEDPVDENHKSEILETETDFVKDGETEYKIVLSAQPTPFEENAAKELTFYLKEATGARIETVRENEISYTEEGKFLLLGKTEAAALNLDYSVAALTSQGFRITTRGNSLFLVGGGDFGTLFAVYELLAQYVGWDSIAADEVIYTTSSDLKFKKVEMTEVPDFEYRVSGNVSTYNDDSIAWRFRFIRAYGNGFMTVKGRLYHNAFNYLPPDVYNDPALTETYHPDWFSVKDQKTTKDLQLCYTAHGNPTEFNAMTDTVLETLYETVMRNPYIDNVQFSLEDNLKWCACKACSDEKLKYGTDSAVVIKFCNNLHRRLQERLAAEHVDRKINLVFYAYHATLEAPVVQNADGSYSPVDEDVVCDDGVYVFYAPVYARYVDGFSEESNRTYQELMKQWGVISKEIYLWIYGTNYNNYLIPYNTFNSMQDTYRFAKENKVRYLFEEGQHYGTTPRPGGFTYLKEYLSSKLMWNVNADTGELTDKFFRYYFRDAAPAMREYFDELRLNFEYNEKNVGMGGGIYENVLETKYWREGALLHWLDLIEEAYDAIEPLEQTDKELYEKLKSRILIESIAPRYLYLSLYCNDSSARTMQMKRDFKRDMTEMNFGEVGQTVDISGLWSQWQV